MSHRGIRIPLVAAGILSTMVLAGAQEAPVDFETQIQPIFTNSCAISGCHTGETLVFGGLSGGGMILLPGQSYDQIVNVAATHTSGAIRVIPGDAEQSLIIRKLEGADGVGSRMPASGGPLDPALIQLIKDWINQGALREAPPATAVTALSWGGVKNQAR